MLHNQRIFREISETSICHLEALVKANMASGYKIGYSKFDEDKFISDFQLLDWTSRSNSNLDVNIDILYGKICQLANSHGAFFFFFKGEKKCCPPSCGTIKMFFAKIKILIQTEINSTLML